MTPDKCTPQGSVPARKEAEGRDATKLRQRVRAAQIARDGDIDLPSQEAIGPIEGAPSW